MVFSKSSLARGKRVGQAAQMSYEAEERAQRQALAGRIKAQQENAKQRAALRRRSRGANDAMNSGLMGQRLGRRSR